MFVYINVFLHIDGERRLLSNWYPYRTLRLVINKKIQEGRLEPDIIGKYDFLFQDSEMLVDIDKALGELTQKKDLELKIIPKRNGVFTKAAKN